jgi:hypothetical protein
VRDRVESPHLARQQAPGRGRKVVGDALGAGVSAVRAAKVVVDVEVRQFGQR